MRNFFNGWRRKIGMVTLILACLFAAGWVRSGIICDRIFFRFCQSLQYVESRRGRIGWEGFSLDMGHVKWETSNSIEEEVVEYHEASRYSVWRWRCLGFSLGQNAFHDSWNSQYCLIPYWAIVIPLTAISGFLLIRKPCQSTPKKTLEPNPEKVA